MKSLLRFVLATSAALAAGACGDNSKECGENTELVDGRCVGTGGPPMCTNGTILDETTNSCVIDPNACQGGTVLIGNECQDPTAGLTIDVEEGAEPNGAGFVETSTTPAGDLTLKPIGEKLVIHGHTTPFRDDDGDGQKDADYDTYFVTVTGPTLLDITVDGVNGAMSAFVVVGTNASNPVNNSASGWIRYGMNVRGDTSKRQIFLPAAGDYGIVFADTRSIYLDGGSPPAAGFGGAAGDATTQYYATIEQLAIPTPEAITLTSGAATVTGTLATGEIKFYTAAMGAGINQATLDVPGVAANPGLVMLQNNVFRDNDDAGPAQLLLLGFDAAETALIVADTTYNYGPDPEAFTLTVRTAGGTALSTNGGSVSEVQTANEFTGVFDLNAFYYDVNGADEIDGIDIAWNVSVDGVLVDENLFILANFSFDPFFGFFGDTWDDYTGLMRHPTAGRYYFLVYNPDTGSTPGTDMITATSTIERKVPVAVTKGTPLTGQSVDTTFASNAFTYTAGVSTDAWQQFNATGTATGEIDLRFFDPATAYGRLDALPSASFPPSEDVFEIFGDTFDEASTTPTGRILLDDGTDSFLVIANTELTAGTPTIDLDFARRDHTDLGSLATPSTTTLTGEALDTTTNLVKRYLLRASQGSNVAITVTPVTAALDTVIDSVFPDESIDDTVDDTVDDEAETYSFTMGAAGYKAFLVSDFYGPIDATYDVTIVVTPPYYTVASSATVFADACMGGTTETIATGNGDDGFTAAIAAPAGFTFFGNAVTSLVASTNGWVSFQAAPAQDYTNNAMPDGIGDANVAPFWDDLDLGAPGTLCTKTVGGKLVIQWVGDDFFDPVQFQAILDPADSSIEFVYGPDHAADGSFATGGVQNLAGSEATQIGFNSVFAPAGSSRKFTH